MEEFFRKFQQYEEAVKENIFINQGYKKAGLRKTGIPLIILSRW